MRWQLRSGRPHRQERRAPWIAGRTRSGAGEAIEVTAGLDHLLAAEVLDDALLGRAVLAHALDQVNVAVGADSLFAEEHKYSIWKLNDKSSKFVTKPALFSITNFLNSTPKNNTRQINELRERRVTKNENGVEEGCDSPSLGQTGVCGSPLIEVNAARSTSRNSSRTCRRCARFGFRRSQAVTRRRE